MKRGRRALGVAESYRGTEGDTSTLAGVVVRADRAVDDFVFGRCTVGGRDSTAAIIDLWNRLDRPDVQYLFVAGVALAWYNIVDLGAVHRAIDRPVVAVSFEASDGLEAGIRDAFEGDEQSDRLEAYRSLPDRRRLETGDGALFVQSIGLEESERNTVIESYTDAERPEPLRVAKRLARRVDSARRDGSITSDYFRRP